MQQIAADAVNDGFDVAATDTDSPTEIVMLLIISVGSADCWAAQITTPSFMSLRSSRCLVGR